MECLDYRPFGLALYVTGAESPRYGTPCYSADAGVTQKFTGKERDAETGLDYFGARYYSGAQGRFTSLDPKQISLQRVLDPQQWNMYSYTRNNPLAYARAKGMTFTFNELFRTQAAQAGIKTGNTKNTTGTSPHAAGLAFDVNVSTSLKPDRSKSLPDLTTVAGGKDANFSPLSDQSKDPPHFQANDLITRDKSGNVDQVYKDLIEENQKSYTELEKERKDKPEDFNKKVVEIDSYTTEKKN